MQIINVNLNRQQFNVLLGRKLMNQVGTLVSERWRQRKVALITDTNVAKLCLDQAKKSLSAQGFTVHVFVLKSGEGTKSLTNVANIIKVMAQERFNRSDGIVALGGGVICDLAGFIASVYMRGIGLIQIPTTLLSQVYSSVSAKASLDLGGVRDLIGRPHQPNLVIIDPDFLKTLSKRDILNGYGEIIKLATLSDGVLWNLVQNVHSVNDVLKQPETLLANAIRFESQIIAHNSIQDERQLLSCGHVISHGLEALSHGKLNHGEAVGIGLVTINQIFVQHGLSNPNVVKQIKACLEAVGLPTQSSLLSNDNLLNAIYKKMHRGLIKITFLKSIGQPDVKSFSKVQVDQSVRYLHK